jgi:hypothetical protein
MYAFVHFNLCPHTPVSATVVHLRFPACALTTSWSALARRRGLRKKSHYTNCVACLHAGPCGACPNEALSPNGTCLCTSGNVVNAQGVCCSPRATYAPQQGCSCTTPGTQYDGKACCPFNSRWQGSITDGECACNTGYSWDGQICRKCKHIPFLSIEICNSCLPLNIHTIKLTITGFQSED